MFWHPSPCPLRDPTGLPRVKLEMEGSRPERNEAHKVETRRGAWERTECSGWWRWVRKEKLYKDRLLRMARSLCPWHTAAGGIWQPQSWFWSLRGVALLEVGRTGSSTAASWGPCQCQAKYKGTVLPSQLGAARARLTAASCRHRAQRCRWPGVSGQPWAWEGGRDWEAAARPWDSWEGKVHAHSWGQSCKHHGVHADMYFFKKSRWFKSDLF